MTPRIPDAAWLKGQVKRQSLEALLTGCGVGLVAAIVLLVTFWGIYVIVWFITLSLFPLSHVTILIISGIGVVLLFVGNATANRRELESFSFTTATQYGRPVHLYIPFVGMGSTINPLAPSSIHSQIKVIASVLCLGPRLASAAVRSFWLSWQLSRIDHEACAAVLTALAATDGPVPFAELARTIPRGRDAAAVLTQIQHLDGVRVVTSDPPGLSLYSELRKTLHKAAGRPGKRKKRKAKPEVPENSNGE